MHFTDDDNGISDDQFTPNDELDQLWLEVAQLKGAIEHAQKTYGKRLDYALTLVKCVMSEIDEMQAESVKKIN